MWIHGTDELILICARQSLLVLHEPVLTYLER